MKKVLFIAVLLLIIACSNSDSNEMDNAANSIVGTWTLVKENIDGNWKIPWDAENTCGNKNKVIISSSGSFNQKVYSIQYSDCELEYDNYGYWELKNDIITFSLTEDKVDGDIASGFIGDYKILELTQNKLIIQEYYQNQPFDAFYEFKKVN